MYFRRVIRKVRFVMAAAFALTGLAQMGFGQNVEVVLSGRDSSDPVTTGQAFIYFLNVTNNGPAAATGVRLTSVLPQKVRYSSTLVTQGSCSQTNGVVTCDLGSLNAGQGTLVRIVTVPTAPGMVTNQTSVSSVEVDDVPTNNSVAIVTTFLNPVRTFSSSDVIMFPEELPGRATPYPSTIMVSGVTASVYKVTVTLPNVTHPFADDIDILLVGPNGTPVMLMSDAGNVDAPLDGVTLTFDDAAAAELPNSEQIFSGTYRPTNHGQPDEVTGLSGPNMLPPAPPAPPQLPPLFPVYPTTLSVFNGTDPNGAWSLYVLDDLSDDGIYTEYVDGWRLDITPIEPIANLELTQTDGPDPTSIGTTITYRVGLTNRGPADASLVWLTNSVPAGLEVLSVSVTSGGCTNVNGTIGCAIGNLANGAGVEFVLQARPLLGGVFSNVVTAGSSLLDLVPANNVSIATTSVTPEADLNVATLVSRSPALLEQPLVYTLLVTNNGPNAATAVRVTDVLPASMVLVNSATSQGSCSNANGTVTCNLGTLASQGRVTVLLTCRPTALGLVTNLVSVTGDLLDNVAGNNQATTVTQVDPAADLFLTLTDAPDPVPIAGTLVYTLSLTNRGPNTASNIFVSDALPSQVQFISAQTSHGVCTNDAQGRVGCTIGELTVGDRATITITTRALVIATIANTAQASGSPVDPNVGNNIASATTSIVPSADLVLSNTGARPTVWQGDTFTYMLVVSNLGPNTATAVRVVDAMPPSFNLFSATASQGACAPQGAGFTCNVGDLIKDAKATITVTVVGGVVGTFTNSASASANEPDLNPANNAASAVTAVIPKAGSFANANAISIPESGQALTYPSSIQVSGLTSAVQQVRVILNGFSHTFPDDVDILLVGPNGAALPLMSDAGGNFAISNLVVTLDDLGVSALPDTDRIVTGVFQAADYERAAGEFPPPAPAGPYANNFGAFTGTDPNGTWSLYVLDDFPKDGGSIAGWTIEFSTRDPIADLVITSSATPNPIAVGSNTVISINVSNRGPAVASGVAMTNVLPASMLVLSTSASQGSCTNENGVLRCQLGTLASRSNAMIQITLRANQAGADSNFVSGAASQRDLNPANNSSLLMLTVEEPPVITQQPVQQNLAQGDTAHFSVSATGAPPLSYQWLRNGNPLPDATNATLVIPDVSTAMAGNYRVRVSNRVASVLSVVVRLTVTGPPTVSEIEDQIIHEDSASGLIVFEISDVETPVDSLTLVGHSSNPTLIPEANILFGGTGSNRTVRVVPAPDQFGTTEITVEVEDLDFGSATESFVVTVLPENDFPAIRAIADQVTAEETPLSVPFVVDDLDLEYSGLTFLATSSNPELVADSGLTVSGSGPNRILTVTPVTDQVGLTLITLTVVDPSQSSASVSFTVTVTQVNDLPSFDPIADLVLAEDPGETVVTISGIRAGPPNENQRLRLSAVSAQPGIIPHPIVEYTSPNATAVLRLSPATNVIGTIPITVTLYDSQAENGLFTQTFNVTMAAVDDPPELGVIADLTIVEDTVLGLPVVVSDPDGAVETVSLTGTSSNGALVPNLNIIPAGTGTHRVVQITPGSNQVGAATITLTVTDTNGTSSSRSFNLTVSAVDDLPAMNPIPDVFITEDSGPQTVTLTGISAGGADEVQTVHLRATSDNAAVLPNPAVNYQSPNATGTLTLNPIANASGTATVIVALDDGVATNSVAFVVHVNATSDAPVIQAIADLTIPEDTPTNVIVRISDVDTLPSLLTLTASSSNTNLVANANLLFEGAGTNRTLTILPNANEFGVSTITLTVGDGTSTANRTFQLAVTAVNDPPTLDPVADVVVNGSPSDFVVSFTGVSGGPGAESTQPVTFSVVSANTGIVAVRSTSASGVTLRPGNNVTGSSLVTVTASDGGAVNGTLTRTFTVYVKSSANTSPIIQDITDKTTLEDVPLGPIGFTISDGQTAASGLSLRARSSNPVLVPESNIQFGGSGGTRTFTITPASNQSGAAVITIIVTDPAFGMAQDSFTLTVTSQNDPPVISDITDKTITEPQTTLVVPFTVSDPDDPAAHLSVSATSQNTALVPATGIVLGGSGTNRAVVLNTIAGATGSSLITVQVSDGAVTRSDTFVVTVNGINDLPTITSIADQRTSEDTPTPPIGFQISDAETPLDQLTLTATSSNPTLVPDDHIAFSGTDSNRTLIVTPVANLYGATLITVKVTDGSNAEASTSFRLNVTPVNEAPVMNPIADVLVNQDAPAQTILLTGIASGAANENDTLLLSAVSGNPNLIGPPTITYASPSDTASLTFAPIPGASGGTMISVTVNDGRNENNLITNSFRVIVNASPTISEIADQVLPEDAGERTVSFTATDDFSPPEELVFAFSSSNPALIPDTSLVSGGSGISRTLSFTALPNQSGVAVITVMVTDTHGASRTTSFDVVVNSVNDLPQISSLVDHVLDEDQPLSAVTFQVSDTETAVEALSVTGTSSNPALVPDGNILISGTGTDRTVSITPATNRFGAAIITLTVHDSDGGAATRTFRLDVTPINDPPRFVQPIPDLVIQEDGTITVPFMIHDVDDAIDQLVIERSSDNDILLPAGGVVIQGSGSNRTAQISARNNENGVAHIELRLRDPAGARETNRFTVTVESVVDLPIIYGLGDILIQEDGEATVGFIASHSEEESANLQATAISSNTNLLANETLLVSGTDDLRTLYLRPQTNQSGESIVTVFVRDSGGHTVSKTFRFTVLPVNDSPQISAISHLETSVGQPTLAAPFNISDVESPATALALAADSSNPALVPAANVELNGTDSSRTVRVVPATGQFGFAVITVHVTDPEGARSSRTFEVLVNQTTGAPAIAQQPQGGTFSSGATVQLRVIATGPGPITYGWQKNGSPLPNETNSILHLPAITRADTGDYNVIVSNSAGPAVSAVAIVRVFDSTRIVNFTRAGNAVQFSFNTTSGQRYTAEYQDALGVGPWNVLGEIDGSGAMATMTDPNATVPTRFYRVRIQ